MTRHLLLLLLALALPLAAHGEEGDLVDQAEQADRAYDAGRWEDALQRYTELVERMPDNADLRFRLANTQARLGRLDEAVASYQMLLARHPDVPKAWHNLAVVRLRQSMQALTEAERYGATGEKLPSRRLMGALEAALGGAPEPEPQTIACPPVPAQALTAYTTARVNLRAGRGPNHERVATLNAATPVDVLRQESGHAEVRDRAGHTGWLPLYLLRLGVEGGSGH